MEKILEYILLAISLVIAIIGLNKKNKDKYNDKLEEFCQKNYKKILIIFVILIFITRLFKFGIYPTQIHCDEAGAAYDAFCLLKFGVDRYLNPFPIYLTNFGEGQSALYAYLIIPCIKLLGNNLIAYRMPALLLHLAEIFIGYLLLDKFKNKTQTLLFTLLLIINPWNIISSRYGLDCNLFGPMLLLDIYLLTTAKENWQYVTAGIAIGLTLYTYAISYIIIPVFLLVSLIYMLYTKKIKIKQILIMGIPIFILALPLIYLILLNMGIVCQERFGIFTITKLLQFRKGEIKFSNFGINFIIAIKTLFLSNQSIYKFEIIFFVIGINNIFINWIINFKKKNFDIDIFIFLSFLSCLFMNSFIIIGDPNRANELYDLILYITTVGMIDSVTKSNKLFLTNLIITAIMTVLFLRTYYFNFNKLIPDKNNKCYDDELYYISDKIEEIQEIQENNQDCNIYVIKKGKTQTFIYYMLKNQISPYDFDKYSTKYIQNTIQKYKNINFIPLKIEPGEKNICIVNNNRQDIITELLRGGYSKDEYIEEYNFCILKNF